MEDKAYCDECNNCNVNKVIDGKCTKCMMKESLKNLFRKTVFPTVFIGCLGILAFNIFKDQPENIKYFYMWLFIGVPFGMKQMCLFLVPRNFDIGGLIGILAFNFVIGGIIGGFVVIWEVLRILWNFLTCLYHIILCLF